MIAGVIRVRFDNQYYVPKAWQTGLPHPQNMQSLSFREALTTDWRSETQDEVWIYPITSLDGPPLRPSKKGTIEQIKSELDISLLSSGIMIDLDDLHAHRDKSGATLASASFYEEVKHLLSNHRSLPGFFYYPTLRGARVGFIFKEPVEMSIGAKARRYVHAELTDLFQHAENIDVDRACLDSGRGFTAPLTNKRNRPIPDQYTAYIHQDDLDPAHVAALADQYDQKEKEVARTANRGTGRRGGPSESASARQEGEPQASATNERRSPIMIPSSIEDLEPSARHSLHRLMMKKLAHSIQNERILNRIAIVLDEELCDGRRELKGENDRHTREALENATIQDSAEVATNLNSLLAPSPLSEFPELTPLCRAYSYPMDELSVAQALVDSMGSSPPPIWHGDGLRRYDPDTGVWRMYSLSREIPLILTSLQGGTRETSKGELAPISVDVGKIKNWGQMVRQITQSRGGEIDTPFDTAPHGVVLGSHYVSASSTGLKISAHSPDHYAIHHLDYVLHPELLQYWDDEDTGQEPKKPKVFIESFLKRSLSRRPHEDETDRTISAEIHAKITTIGQWIGLALLGLCTREATALVCFGEGSNGKSVLASLISDLFGAERTAHLAPQAMKERFSRAQLFGAAVNVVSEMPETDLLESDTLKALISGDAITVEHKNERPFRMLPRAAHFFAANRLPSSRDRSHGLWRRLVPIEFHHIFSGDERDPDLLNKLRAEYDVLVPWALDLARQYIERQGYQYQNYIDLWRGSWRVQTDALSGFVCYRCDFSDEGSDVEALWAEFKIFCDSVGQSGAAKMALNAFARSLRSQPGVESIRKRVDGRKRTLYNLKINTDKDAWSL